MVLYSPSLTALSSTLYITEKDNQTKTCYCTERTQPFYKTHRYFATILLSPKTTLVLRSITALEKGGKHKRTNKNALLCTPSDCTENFIDKSGSLYFFKQFLQRSSVKLLFFIPVHVYMRIVQPSPFRILNTLNVKSHINIYISQRGITVHP